MATAVPLLSSALDRSWPRPSAPPWSSRRTRSGPWWRRWKAGPFVGSPTRSSCPASPTAS